MYESALSWMKLYGTIISKESQRFFTYRSNITANLLSAVFALAVRYALWLALFSTGAVQDTSLSETMTYFVVNDLLLVWISTRYANTIGGDIRSGDIATRLTKPFPYHFQLVASSHASALVTTITRALPTLIIALFWVGLMPPASALAMGCFIVTAVFGGVLCSLIDLIISYTAFWLTDYWYISWFSRALFCLFGGTMLPLWFYPAWLHTLCDYLPFRYAVYQPMAFYLGRVPVSDFGASLLMQLLWISVLFALERFVWRLAQHKLTVQGG